MNTVFFNNLNSYEDLNLGLYGGYELPIPQEEVEKISIEKRIQGSLTIKSGNYKDSVLKLKFKLFPNYLDSDKKTEKIIAWVNDIKDNKLYFSNDFTKAYVVKTAAITKVTKNNNKHWKDIEVEFNCEPFLVFPLTLPRRILQGEKVFNNGDIDTFPNLIIKLPPQEQNLKIYFDDKFFELKGVRDFVKIDSLFFRVLDKDNNSISIKMKGDFPILRRGYNTINWEGNIISFEMEENIKFKG